MARERIFTASGFIPKRGMHPVLGLLLLAYAGFIIYILVNTDFSHVRIVGPGILPLLLLSFAKNRSDEAITIFLDRVENDELCLGYSVAGKTEQKEFFVDEYSYWYSPNKSDGSKVDLFFWIKTVKKETILLKEEKTTLSYPEKWETQNEKNNSAEITIKLKDIEGLTVQMDRYSS